MGYCLFAHKQWVGFVQFEGVSVGVKILKLRERGTVDLDGLHLAIERHVLLSNSTT